MAEIVQGNSQNDVSGYSPRTRSNFNLSAPFGNTPRFAEYSPHLVIDCVADDKRMSYRSGHDVRTYSFKAPLMQNVRLIKDYFLVPREAILPRNWAKILVNPKHGDDVNAVYVNSVVPEFYQKILVFGKMIKDYDDDNPTTINNKWYLYFWILLELFLSKGSLLSCLGSHPSKALVSFNRDLQGALVRPMSFDKAFDLAMSVCQQNIQSVTIAGTIWSISSENDLEQHFATWRVILDMIRADISRVWSFTLKTSNSFRQDMHNLIQGFVFKQGITTEVDLAFPVAYQMSCAHYYSNDNIDFVYSADLYRQACQSLAHSALGSSSSFPEFTYNGVKYQYDVFSAYVFDEVFKVLRNADFAADEANLRTAIGYIQNIFSYQRTLRYQDYFTGARSQPLAVGGVNINVQSGTPNFVSAVDVTRNIQKQRMLNAVLRSRSQLEEYLKDIFHSNPAPDYHNPFFICETVDDVYAQEVENTGDAQLQDANSVTSVLKSYADKFAFEVDIDRPSIIIGISHFDITRFYADGTRKMHTHEDRFSMFNPFMQYIGDQPIDRSELDSGLSGTFAYTGRHMEYKQNIPECAGGFSEFLPGYSFLAPSINEEHVNTISPEFIRSKNYEFDKFYVSLTGYSLASYFHFIVKNNNEIHASRPMAYNPNIL